MTYHQLDIQSAKLANFLIKRGVRPKSIVPFCLERGIEVVVTIVSILRCGAAYVPIDPSYPSQRKNYILNDLAAKVLVTSSVCRSELEVALTGEVIEIDTDWVAVNKESEKLECPNPKAGD